MKHVAEQADGPVVDLGRPHERRPVEVPQQLKGADAGIDLGYSRQRRRGGGIDAGEPEVGRDKDLRMPKAARILRADRILCARRRRAAPITAKLTTRDASAA